MVSEEVVYVFVKGILNDICIVDDLNDVFGCILDCLFDLVYDKVFDVIVD